jgi:ATP-dependent protease ClpP protease subunit
MKKIVIDGYIGQWQFSKTYVREMLKGSTNAEEVEVNVSSLGGDFNHAIDIHDQFAAHGNVSVVYTGMNASSATIISLGAKKVKMSENSFYLVHKPMGWIDVFDSLNEDDIDALITSLENKKNELAKFTLVLARMYSDKTGMPVKDILNLMKEETWLTADMAKEKGFIDEIIKPSQITNYLEDSNLMTMIAASGFPVPGRPKQVTAPKTEADQPEAYDETKLINKLRKIFNPIDTMKKQFDLVNSVLKVEKLESTADGIFLNEEQLESIETKMKADADAIASKPETDTNAIEALNAEIVTLKADLATARKAPAAAPAAAKGAIDNLDKNEDINAKLESMTMAERIEYLKK